MATAILSNDLKIGKHFSSKIKHLYGKKEFSMMKRTRSIPDFVSPKERLKTPLSYHWLKFKTGFFGLVLQKGIVK